MIFDTDDFQLPTKIPPLPKYDVPKTRKCILIPAYFGGDIDAVQRVLRGAFWGLWSILKYSDAIDEKIDVRFYTDTVTIDTYFSMFIENGIHIDRWIHLITEDAPIPKRFYKKSAMFGNVELFEKYDTFFIWDSDQWVLPPRGGERVCFQRFFNTHPVLSAIAAYDQYENIGEMLFHIGHISDRVLYPAAKKNSQRRAQKKRITQLLLDKHIGHRVSKPRGALYAISPSIILRDYPDFLPWIQQWSQFITYDEELLLIADLHGVIDLDVDMGAKSGVRWLLDYEDIADGFIYHGHLDKPEKHQVFDRLSGGIK